jgi:hypothetical protein
MKEEIEFKWSFGTVYSLLFMYVYEVEAWGLPSWNSGLKQTHTHRFGQPATSNGSHFWNKAGVNRNSKEADTTKGRGH